MQVYTGASISLDGFIAGPQESGFEHLFAWMGAGEVSVPTADPGMTLALSPEDAEFFRERMATTGAIVVGRHLYDFTHGWGGQHPLGCPVVVVTHEPPAEPSGPDFHFVTTGIQDAVQRAAELAGDKVVGVNAGEIAQQCLDAGLLDEIWVDVSPVYLGAGKPFFPSLGSPLVLEQVDVRVGAGVTHLRYRIRK